MTAYTANCVRMIHMGAGLDGTECTPQDLRKERTLESLAACPTIRDRDSLGAQLYLQARGPPEPD